MSLADLSPSDAPVAVHALRRANRALLQSIDGLDHETAQAESKLPNWNRASILTHLAHVGRSLVRMTDEALTAGATSTYPGGVTERSTSIKRARLMAADQIAKELETSIEELEDRWSLVTEQEWGHQFELDGLHQVPLTHLLMQRWTEVEVHLSDLGFNRDDFSVSDLYVAAALPIRVEWLIPLHRERSDADKSISGEWKLKASTSRQAWTIRTPNAPSPCTIEGPDEDLLGFILGRVPVSQMTVAGNVGLAYRFKLAFPGP